MKDRAKNIIAAAFNVSRLLPALERLEKRLPNTLYVLSYHRVDRAEHRDHLLDPDLLSATPDEFTRQMQFVSSHYHPITAGRLVEAIRGDHPLPRRAILITFDDAYRDFAENAWPVLKRERIPAILFVSSAYPGDDSRVFWWDGVHQMLRGTDSQEVTLPQIGILRLEGDNEKATAKERLKSHLSSLGRDEREAYLEQLQCQLGVIPQRNDSLLTWEDLNQLAAEGVTIASHTHSHAILTRLSDEQVVWEAQTSQHWIRQQTGQEWPIFCYPNGRRDTFNRHTGHILKENGYVAAFTMIGGANVIGQTPPLAMRRFGVDCGDSLHLFRLRLTALYSRWYRWAKPAARSLEVP